MKTRNETVFGAVQKVVYGAVSGAVDRAVYVAVGRAMNENTRHPGLQDFLLNFMESR